MRPPRIPRALPIALALAALAAGAPRRASAQASSTAAVPTPIAAGDSARPESIERLLQVANMERVYNQGIDAGIEAQLKGAPQLAPYSDVLRAFMMKYNSYAIVKPDLVRVYREAFSEADIQETIRFYQSPFGQRLMSRLPQIMSRSAQLSAARTQEHLPELMRMINERMQQGATTPATTPAAGADSSARAKPPAATRRPPA
ncbi:MAG TPA: DUF2059 domain-containing protein [Gemmatimonadaceae bacterium]|nr:DUF2059 domain-containing protein [Gemmatimonadaceae bacterium]